MKGEGVENDSMKDIGLKAPSIKASGKIGESMKGYGDNMIMLTRSWTGEKGAPLSSGRAGATGDDGAAFCAISGDIDHGQR